VAERVGHHYGPIVCAGTITCCPDPREIVGFLPQVKPHFFFAVPRIWEKLKAGLEAMLESQPAEQAAPLRAALEDALSAVRLQQQGQDVPAELAERVAANDQQIFSNIRAMFGLDEAKFVGVGAAPTPPAVIEFFHAIGVRIAEVWGMSETSGIGTANPPDAVRIGTVGPPIEGAEITIADDGEVLIRGKLIMRGYRNKPEATAEAIDSDGWLHTGDAAYVDEEGFYFIVDRWKDMFISGGENVYPAEVEDALYRIPDIAEAAVIGIADDKWGEVGRAFIVLREGSRLNADDILEHCARNLARFKIPKTVRFLAELPHNATGKVTKHALPRD
jgi:long-subunit acyl-CoA synthetase (AMP-forming)